MRKTATSFRLSEEARSLINALSEYMGISQADVMEFAVREAARKLGLQPKAVGLKAAHGSHRITGGDERPSTLLEEMGAWDDERSTDEIIRDIYAGRSIGALQESVSDDGGLPVLTKTP